MRYVLLVVWVAVHTLSAQIYIGVGIPIGRSVERQNGVPDTLATWLESECDVKPKYPGGPEAWLKHLSAPDSCVTLQLDDDCHRRTQVVVRFIVERDGTVSNAEVVRRACGALDELALCAVRSSRPWTPGRRGGWKVRTRMQVPIRYETR